MKQEVLGKKSLHATYLHYLLPTLMAMVSSSMYCLADVYFIAKGVGSTGLAALNIAMPLFSIYAAIGLCIGVGAATIMSICEGNHQFVMRNRAFSLAIFIMVVVGLIGSVVGFLFTDNIALLFGSSEALLPSAREYMAPIVASSIVFILMYATSILLRGDHAPKTAMTVSLLGNFTNIVLDYVFIILWKQGLYGASMATVIGAGIVVIATIPHFIRRKNTVHFTIDIFHAPLVKRMLRNGFGSGIMEISNACVVVIFNSVIMYMADETFLAAFAIITNLAYVCRGLCNGFAQASQPILSFYHGAKKDRHVWQSLRIALCYTTVFSCIVYGLLLLFPMEFARIFANGNQALITLASQGIRLYFISLLFTAPLTVMMYYFQSIEKGHVSTLVAIGRGFIFVIVGLFLLLSLFGVKGIWLTTPFAEGLAFVCSIVLLRRLGRKQA